MTLHHAFHRAREVGVEVDLIRRNTREPVWWVKGSQTQTVASIATSSSKGGVATAGRFVPAEHEVVQSPVVRLTVHVVGHLVRTHLVDVPVGFDPHMVVAGPGLVVSLG